MHGTESTKLTILPAARGETHWIAAMSRDLVERGLPWSWTPRRVARHVADPDSIVLTAHFGATPAGFAIMQYDDDTAHLNLLAVDPARRRLGIARRLIAWLEKSAVVAGTFVISVEVRACNGRARAFYRRLGYREVVRVPGYYFGVEDAIRLARNLSARR